MKKETRWITRTAALTALLIVVQAVTAPLGNIMITGSLVNFILIAAVMIGDLSSGVTIAVISPVFAKLVGIGPLWLLIPFIAIANAVLVLTWHFIGKRTFGKERVPYAAATGIAAVLKFFVLYVGIVRIAIPVLLQLPQPQATIISNMFSLPQLFTALIGGALAVTVLPILLKVVKKNR